MQAEHRKLNIIELVPGKDAPSGDEATAAVGESIPPNEAVRAVLSGNCRHVVQRNAPSFESELRVAKIMVENPEEYLADPIRVIVGHSVDSDEVLGLKVESSVDDKKVRTLYQFESFLKALPGTKTIRESALLVADELYTNAARNGWPQGVKRGEGPLREGHVGFYACVYDKRLVFGCVDSFGELSVSRLLGRINQCFEQGVANAIQTGTGGAGIGSYMVFNSAMSYYIAVAMGRRSVIMVSMPLGLSSKSVAEIPKNLHVLSVRD